MYFCFPAAALPQIHVQGGKCTCLSSFLLTPLHASNICFVLFCLLLCLLVWGLFLRASENHRIGKKKKNQKQNPAAIHKMLFKTRIPPEWCSGLGHSLLPPARSRGAGSLAAVQAGSSLRSNFPCRNSARRRQPDKAALTLIEIFSLVMLEHQSSQQ